MKPRKVAAKTENQQLLINSIYQNMITFVAGPAGTGKTFLSLAMAINLLKDKKRNYNRILITRPQIATKRMPFLPGTESEKGAPFIRPLKETLNKILIASEIDSLLATRRIDAMTLEYMRGMSIDNSIVILDEAQNVEKEEMLMFLTRLGMNSKFIITGDLDQTDLNKTSGLKVSVDSLQDIPEVGVVFLTDDDIVRNPLIKTIINRLSYYERFSNLGKNSDKAVSYLDGLTGDLEEEFGTKKQEYEYFTNS